MPNIIAKKNKIIVEIKMPAAHYIISNIKYNTINQSMSVGVSLSLCDNILQSSLVQLKNKILKLWFIFFVCHLQILSSPIWPRLWKISAGAIDVNTEN